ncbi:hypothetical protein FOC4_g10007942 [Fusarium odoratissimum]|uniref:BTB domain-containing protein n=3 Tax=Fusarium oxysporum species complex TaxID=171631 RepID=N1RJZ3_FUSC4|nr:uncharacterized protein FOIG_04045 [Fusarium odoratissimum NRRL 54006]EMT65831.1 hypothetical protein FOC4_g10007942 [Fusarium odoratissimum]EXM05457.1 hypothetical protein FOIG_04045 [Fusarium odoratissimum NRRL 54006]TXC00436.1 hypothetical protein FocTR4_00014386 [Fusarium oxysporum f. sp. cubense]
MDTSPPVLNDDKGGVPSDSVTQIVTDGDVLMVVGPSQHKIQVSSHFLKHISPVFRAMLDAPMKEGEALANKCDDDAPVEIVFPEDKEQPMVQVLHTLYGSDPSARRFSKGEVKEIAILAEKYGMVERIAIFASFWLRNAVKKSISEITKHVWNTLVVAYILKIDWAFFDITKAILQTRTSLLKFIGSFHDKHTGLRLGMAIEELRSTYLAMMARSRTEMGLCLFCFSHATESFTQQRAGCSYPDRHFPTHRLA